MWQCCQSSGPCIHRQRLVEGLLMLTTPSRAQPELDSGHPCLFSNTILFFCLPVVYEVVHSEVAVNYACAPLCWNIDRQPGNHLAAMKYKTSLSLSPCPLLGSLLSCSPRTVVSMSSLASQHTRHAFHSHSALLFQRPQNESARGHPTRYFVFQPTCAMVRFMAAYTFLRSSGERPGREGSLKMRPGT